MSAFQHHFRNGFERVARDVFEQIGFGLGARAFLVGFTDDPARVFPVFFELEHDPLAAVDLSSVVADAQKGYADSDESRMMYGSRRHHERNHRAFLDAFRAEAVLSQAAALIWFAHIGLDRALGYGLKYDDSFQHTHLGWIGKRAT